MSSSAVPRARHNPLPFIVLTVLIDTIGLGVIIPVVPDLIRELSGQPVAEAARIGGWLGFSYAAMQFLCGPLIGNLSDRFGRRPVLLASLAAFGLDYAIAAFAPTLGWLFVARLIAGVTGASFTSAYAFVADVSPPDKRAQNFGLVGLGFGLGFMIGPALGGVVGHAFGPRAPFIAAAVLAGLNFAYGWFVLPESLPPERRRRFDWRRANPIGALGALRRGRGLAVLAAVMLLWQLAAQSLQSNWTFYTTWRFGWGPDAIGWSLAAVGVSVIFVQGGGTGLLIPRWGERRAAVVGMASGLAGYLIYAAATQGWMMYLGIAVSLLVGLAYPSLNAIMSARVGEDSQGELQGAVSSLFSLSAMVGPALMNQLFAYFVGPAAPVRLPGVAFWLAALLTAVALALFLAVERTPRVDHAR